MRVDCLTFLDPTIYRGGGENITSELLAFGRKRGHDIRISSVRPTRKAFHTRPDVVLLFDVFNFSHSVRSLGAWRRFGDHFIECAIARAPFVHLTTAYPDVCNLPYLPCSGLRGDACPKKPLPHVTTRLLLKDFGTACFADRPLVNRLFSESALNCFFSPLHREVTVGVLKLNHARPSLILGPMIDVGMFQNLRHERDIDYLFVGVICEAKGLGEMRDRFYDADIVLVGRLGPGIRMDFGRHITHLPYAEVPLWMNKAKNFVFLPRWPEPQGRVVAEAALCGCNIIGNANVGALTLGFDLADPNNYGGVEKSFWEAVEAVV